MTPPFIISETEPGTIIIGAEVFRGIPKPVLDIIHTQVSDLLDATALLHVLQDRMIEAEGL